jgi:hypothetical protein
VPGYRKSELRKVHAVDFLSSTLGKTPASVRDFGAYDLIGD